jgi:hypothetical protein
MRKQQLNVINMKLITIYILCIITLVSCSPTHKQDIDFLIVYTEYNDSLGYDLYGYKNTQGEVVIKPKYQMIETDTFRTMAVVAENNVWKCINRQEKVIFTPFIYDNGPDYVVEDVFRFVKNDSMGFANLDGKVIIPADFDFVTPFEEGLALYTLGGHKQYDKGPDNHWFWVDGCETGYVNHLGQRFSSVSELQNGKRNALTRRNKQVILDKTGNIVEK